MKKTCIELGLKECSHCSFNVQHCWVDTRKKDIILCQNISEVKKYLIKNISAYYKSKYYLHHIDYIKAVAKSISPEYSSFIDKILLLI